MGLHFIQENDFGAFVARLIAQQPVIAPVAKKNKFVFATLQRPDELRLDYDVTLLPPKTAFYPPKQDLLTFGKGGVKSAINPRPQILFGVHFYDIKAIDMLDGLFRKPYADNNYLAQRKMTTIIGSNVQRVSERAFWGSIGVDVPAQGHDGFITRISGGYVYEDLTEKGKDLLQYGTFSKAGAEQVSEASAVNKEAFRKCPETLEFSARAISDKVRVSFGKELLWEGLARDCFSCGSCNMVCPTCYCFDVQDQWNVDQVSGVRYRRWDGCLLEDFAQVSLGTGGATENFREKRAHRFRHRVMRKLTYLNEQVGGPACVGCGRCSASCVPDIADPVKIVNKIMKG